MSAAQQHFSFKSKVIFDMTQSHWKLRRTDSSPTPFCIPAPIPYNKSCMLHYDNHTKYLKHMSLHRTWNFKQRTHRGLNQPNPHRTKTLVLAISVYLFFLISYRFAVDWFPDASLASVYMALYILPFVGQATCGRCRTCDFDLCDRCYRQSSTAISNSSSSKIHMYIRIYIYIYLCIYIHRALQCKTL